MHNPKEIHLKATYSVLHYLKSIPRISILIKQSIELRLEAYPDAKNVRLVIHRKINHGLLHLLSGKSYCMISKKHNMVDRSSAESKYRDNGTRSLQVIIVEIISENTKIK